MMIDPGTITRDEKLDSRSRKTPRRSRKKLVTLRCGGRKGKGERKEQRERQKSHRGKLVDIPRLYRPAE